uniref:Uncharacterized protein n=1 Tax=Aegilops tauschii subsp. strangulata TaxID=200361 RepID=A0A453DY24_AEGTS
SLPPSSSDSIDAPCFRSLARRMVSLSACAKFGAVSFVVGVVVGFTLKKRLRRWAAKLLKRIKDDE